MYGILRVTYDTNTNTFERRWVDVDGKTVMTTVEDADWAAQVLSTEARAHGMWGVDYWACKI